jgi:hypothetical protein
VLRSVRCVVQHQPKGRRGGKTLKKKEFTAHKPRQSQAVAETKKAKMVSKTGKDAGVRQTGGSISVVNAANAVNAGVEKRTPARALKVVCDEHQSFFVMSPDGMKCGHHRCRHCSWWASQEGRHLWNGSQGDSPVPCVFSHASVISLPLSWCPLNFAPLQPAVVCLKRLNPVKNKITHEHVLRSVGDSGSNLSADQTEAMIAKFQDEAIQVTKWGTDEVKKWMSMTAARLGLKHGSKPVDSFEDLKKSWEMDGSKTNTGNFCEICHGDCEEKKTRLEPGDGNDARAAGATPSARRRTKAA